LGLEDAWWDGSLEPRGHTRQDELAHAVGMCQVEGDRGEAAHRTSHQGDGAQTALIQYVREERCAEFRHVDAPVVEWVGKTMPRPVGNIEMESTRQRGQDRDPATSFAESAVDQDQRWAFA